MNLRAFMVAGAVIMASCHHHHTEESHPHEGEKFRLTAYHSQAEVFLECDPLIKGHSAIFLSHFSILPDFKPLIADSIAIALEVNGSRITQTVVEPVKAGIYKFELKPGIIGNSRLKFRVFRKSDSFEVEMPQLTVYSTSGEGLDAAANSQITEPNTAVFTKEQSWKTDFASGFPGKEPFGPVIKTTALVQPSQENEVILNARINGIVMLSPEAITEGKEVMPGKVLFTISGNGLPGENLEIKYKEAVSNYERAKQEFDRSTELARERIVSQKDLQLAKNNFENAKAVYESFRTSFTTAGQPVTSPIPGFVKQVFIRNGAFVQAGDPVLTVTGLRKLTIRAEVPQKYSGMLPAIKSATLKSLNDSRIYSLDELNGKILSYGKAATADNYLIPVTIQIDNKGGFLPGSFIELNLITANSYSVVTIPNTALLEEQGTYFVWVQKHPELFEKREVKIGAANGLKTEIVSGITETERIVTRGAMMVKLAQSTGTLDAHSGHVH